MESNTLERQPLLSVDNGNNITVNSKSDTMNKKLTKQTNPDTAAVKNSILGVILVIMAGMSFTGSNIIQKFVIPEVTFWQLLFTRAFVQTLLTGCTCLIMHFKFRSGIFVFQFNKKIRPME